MKLSLTKGLAASLAVAAAASAEPANDAPTESVAATETSHTANIPQTQTATTLVPVEELAELFNPRQSISAVSANILPYSFTLPIGRAGTEESYHPATFINAITGREGDIVFTYKHVDGDGPNFMVPDRAYVTSNVRLEAPSNFKQTGQLSGEFQLVADLRPASKEQVLQSGLKAGNEYYSGLSQVIEPHDWTFEVDPYEKNYGSVRLERHPLLISDIAIDEKTLQLTATAHVTDAKTALLAYGEQAKGCAISLGNNAPYSRADECFVNILAPGWLSTKMPFLTSPSLEK